MRPGVRTSIVAAFVLLLIIGTFVGEDTRPVSPTTFGTVPGGYRALFELLSELGFPVTRSYVIPDAHTAPTTRWWLEARGLCRPPARLESPADDWDENEWILAGGTAVVFLPWAPRDAECRLVVGMPVPARTSTSGAEWRVDMGGSEGTARTHQVTGDLGNRTLHVPTLLAFAQAGDWTVRASVGALPLVLERSVGAGAVVLVADPLFLRNAWLDSADGAPFAVDLVRAYGVPTFDEHQLGPRAGRSATAYLATSPALAVFVGLALTGLLFAWHGTLVPERHVTEVDRGAPRIDAFVDAVAGLYARTGDHVRVLERYRALTAGRLRRHLGLPPDTPLETLVHRLGRDPRTDAGALRLLAEGKAPAGEPALRDAVRALDGLVRAVTA